MARVIFPNLGNYTPPDHSAGTGQIYLKNDDAYLKLYGQNEKLLGGGSGLVKQYKNVTLCGSADYTQPNDAEVLLTTVSYTPTSASSKIEIRFTINASVESGKWLGVKLFRDGNLIGIPAAVTNHESVHSAVYGVGTDNINQVSLTFVDEPNTTNPFLYGIVLKSDGDYSVNKVRNSPTGSPITMGTLTITEYEGSLVSNTDCGASVNTLGS